MSKSNMISILINSNKILNNSAGINTSRLDPIIDTCFSRGYIPNDKIIIENILSTLLLKNNLSSNIGTINNIIDKLSNINSVGSLDTLRFIIDKIYLFEIAGERETILNKINNDRPELTSYIEFIKFPLGTPIQPQQGITSQSQLGTTPSQQGTPQSLFRSATQSLFGSRSQSPQGTPLQSPQGTPLQSPQGIPLQSPQGIPLQSPQGTPQPRTIIGESVGIKDMISSEYYSLEIKSLKGYGYNKIECRFVAYFVNNSKDKKILVIEKKNNFQSVIKLKNYSIKKINLDTIRKIPNLSSKINLQKKTEKHPISQTNYFKEEIKETNEIRKVEFNNGTFFYVYVPKQEYKNILLKKRPKGYFLYKDYDTKEDYQGFNSINPSSGPSSSSSSSSSSIPLTGP